MSRYTLRYLYLKEKKFNKMQTLCSFAYRNAYRMVEVRKGNELIPFPLKPEWKKPTLREIKGGGE